MREVHAHSHAGAGAFCFQPWTRNCHRLHDSDSDSDSVEREVPFPGPRRIGASRHDLFGEPVDGMPRLVVMQRRLVLVLLVLTTTACGSYPAAPDDVSMQVEGVRTDPDGRALVATYTGGACDGPARLDLRESQDRVELSVRLTDPPEPEDGSVCVALAVGGSVRADLSRPLGTRAVVAEGITLRVFDGADLIVPSPVPAGFTLASEMGSQDRDTWMQTFTNTPAGELTGPCDPRQRSFSTQAGSQVRADMTNAYIVEEPAVSTRSGPARQFRNEAAPLRLLTLTVDGRLVSVSYSADCGGPRPPVDEVMPFLDALQVVAS